MATIKLNKKIVYTGKIQVVTGMHIGGTNTAMGIGGPDKFIVRNPLSGIPYIPGSSLKGKMRALIEMADGTIDAKEGATSDPDSNAGYLFGTASGSEKNRASRIIVRDAEMDVSHPELFSKCDLPFAESKTESSIDRVRARSTPRTFERVPAGAEFKFEIIINVFDTEDEKRLCDTFKRAVSLLENDYLGGQGSRGYGQVKIVFDNIDGVTKTF